jgi:hypothetical protein
MLTVSKILMESFTTRHSGINIKSLLGLKDGPFNNTHNIEIGL